MAKKLTVIFVALAAFTFMLCISEANSVPDETGILPKKIKCNLLDLLNALIKTIMGILDGTITNNLDALLKDIADFLGITVEALRKLLSNITGNITLKNILEALLKLIDIGKENTGDLTNAVLEIIAGLLGIEVVALLGITNVYIYICL